MKKTVRLLNSSHAGQYEKVLSLAFASAAGFTTRPEAARWSHVEDYYPTLGLFHDDTLVSTMRIEWVHTQRELDYKLHANFQLPDMVFPAVYLTKAGTLPHLKAGGYNSILRYYALKLALHWKSKFVFGTMVEGSPRVFSMTEMGYNFKKNPAKWDGYFVSDKTPLIAWLDMPAKGASAIEYLEKSLGSTLNEYVPEFQVETITCKTDKDIRFPWSA
ncbi:MAG: hypothetical protein EOP06_26150 [Proteobacteria bacterium]|nr:MAG: hypothetical protein EOP06_26150 [Pseudomonadota bacterium]